MYSQHSKGKNRLYDSEASLVYISKLHAKQDYIVENCPKKAGVKTQKNLFHLKIILAGQW